MRLGILVAALFALSACPDGKKTPPPKGNGNAVDRPAEVTPPPVRHKHAQHEHYHGQHPHAGNDHHHHAHPHPHLAGLNNHHHPY